MTKIAGSTVFVTGASGGIGAEFVRQALSRGAVKVYAASRNPSVFDDDRVVPVALDVADETSVAAAAALAGDVNIVVNNAGIIGAPSLLSGEFDDIRKTYDTNVFGVLHVTRAFADGLIARGGAVINIASALSWIAVAGAYSSSKSAVWGLTNTLRLELGRSGVRVLGVHVGYVDTPMVKEIVGVPKTNPADVVRLTYDGLENGLDEVIVDDVASAVRAGLSTNTTAAFG